MSQWTVNCYGERVHKRQRRRRANCVFLFKKIINEDDELPAFLNYVISIYTAKPKVKGAYPSYPGIIPLYTFERKDKQHECINRL
jgi:hypothetical protein